MAYIPFLLQVDGNVLVVYNVGLTDHVISDPYVKVNDGKYHVIRFTRSGANSTLRIDDLPLQIKVPTGETLHFIAFRHCRDTAATKRSLS